MGNFRHRGDRGAGRRRRHVARRAGRARSRLRYRRRKPTRPRQQAAQQVAQPLNNQPVWSESPLRAAAVHEHAGRETNVLIQPQGQTWRALRVPVATVGGFLVAFALVVLAAFYLWRGPITVHGPPTGRLIERFTIIREDADRRSAVRQGFDPLDGRTIHPAYLFEVKKPEESKGPWDYYKLIGTIPADQAFRPLSESTCPLVKK